ncbi:HNH endonuclease signature motif containing protein [Aliarcobacter butzleri]|uniref:HNH endonuclease signature motif containing protein n=1 Tax=Aliarcobacter butzleri TaxID=28197 RepID=UPI00263DB175|nr:HNH endonuclease signature motif containing protein [Aliarcobacter butzleri]MDN5077620.1 HNH endonuclease signature motif containing protein [Aliarcobacter butzleri]MDN5118832.1 HNH endonuclease signature motif containing protein [Aliarcobacter butzleri]
MKYLKEHEDFLKKHETTPRKKLTELFNAKFKTQISIRNIAQKCRKLGLVCLNDGRFKKGMIPANKGTKGLTGANRTSFRPGNRPVQTKRVGTISTRKDKNGSLYMHIKISEPNKWQMLHVYIWEQKHGKVPEGCCVIFKDKNTLNTRLDNLMLVSRAELARLNQKYAYIDKSLKETALQVIKISKEIRKNLKSKENYA